MGCINASKLSAPPKEIKNKMDFNSRLTLLITQGNLQRLKRFISEKGVNNIDFTSV